MLLCGGGADAETGGECRSRKVAFLLGVVVVGVEAVGVGDAVPLKVEDAACDGLTWAWEGVVGGAVCNALTFHRILLVRERERDLGHAVDVVVIQRCDDGSVHAAAHGDSDVANAEGLGERVGVVA